MEYWTFQRERELMRRAILVAAVVLAACGGEVGNVDRLEGELRASLEDRDLGMYVTGVEEGGGQRVRVLTQLTEDQTDAADAICNNTTAVAYGLDDVEVSGVDVAAAGGRNIAHCEPRV